MPIGQLGAVRAVPKPSSQVAAEALNLLSALGGGDKTARKTLEEMKAVQAHNEALVETAKAIIADADKRQADVAKAEAGLAKARADFEAERGAAEGRIARLDNERKDRAARMKAEQDDREKALDEREKALAAREQAVAATEADLASRAAKIAEDEAYAIAARAEAESLRNEQARRVAGLKAAVAHAMSEG